MVTASKVEAPGYSVGTGVSAASTAPPQDEVDCGSMDNDEGFSLRASSLCYGEQLVLDTYLRTRNRPYDRERQEELAKPRKRGASMASWQKGQAQYQMMAQLSARQPSRPAQPQKPPREPSEGEYYSDDDGWADNTAGQEEFQRPLPLLRNRVPPRAPADVRAVVERLAKPKVIKRDKVGPGEEQVLLYLKDIRQKGEKTDIREVVGRLSTPKVQRPLSPTPGERVVLNYNMTMQGRRCNPKRIDQLAKAPPRRCFLGSGRTWRNVHEATGRAENDFEELDTQVALDFDSHETPEQASQTPARTECMTYQADEYNRDQLNGDEDDLNCRGASGGSYAGGTSATLETDAGRSSPISSPPSTATTYPPSSATTPARTGTSGTCGGAGIPNLPEVPSGSPTAGSGSGGAAPSSTPRGRAPGTWRSGVDGKA